MWRDFNDEELRATEPTMSSSTWLAGQVADLIGADEVTSFEVIVWLGNHPELQTRGKQEIADAFLAWKGA
jgi:hypothetical protein